MAKCEMGATPGMLPSYLRNSMCCALLLQSNRSALVLFYFSTFLFFLLFSKKKFWLGGRPPVFWLGGQSAPRPPLNGRWSHLIEAAKRGRLDQMFFLSGAADDTRAADVRQARPDVRPNAR